MMLTSGRDTRGGGGVGMCRLLEDMSHLYSDMYKCLHK